MKTIVSVILLFVWMAETPLLYFSAQLEREALRSSLFKRIDASEIVTITLNESEPFYFEDEGKELIYNGKRFDILSITSADGHTKVLVYNDTEEQELDKASSTRKEADDGRQLKRLIPYAVMPDITVSLTNSASDMLKPGFQLKKTSSIRTAPDSPPPERNINVKPFELLEFTLKLKKNTNEKVYHIPCFGYYSRICIV